MIKDFKDMEQLIAALTASEMQLQSAVASLQKYSNIENQLKALDKLDTAQIAKQLEQMDYSKIAATITQQLEKKLDMATQNLEKKTELLAEKVQDIDIVLEGLNTIDNSAENIDKIAKAMPKMSIKLPIVTALVSAFAVGILSFAAANLNTVFGEKVPGDSRFIERVQPVQFYDSDGKIWMELPININIIEGQSTNENTKWWGFQKQ